MNYGVYGIAWQLLPSFSPKFSANYNYNIFEQGLVTQRLFPPTCGSCWETGAFEVNLHPIVSLSWCFCISQQRNGLGGTRVLVRG